LECIADEVVHLRIFSDTNAATIAEKTKELDSGAKILNTPNELHIFIFRGEAMSSALIQTLKLENLPIKSISYSGATLDDVFLYYAGQRMFEETV